MENLPNIFKPPTYEDDEKNRRAEFLHYGSILLFVANVAIYWIFEKYGTQAAQSVSWTLGIIPLLQILVQWMIRTGRVNTASLVELNYGWLAMTWIM